MTSYGHNTFARLAANIAPPVYRAESSLRTAAATANNDPGKPSGTTNDDLLIAIVGLASKSDTVATPSGWSLESGPDDTTGGAAIRGYVFSAKGSVSTTQFTKTGTNGAMRISIVAVNQGERVHKLGVSTTSTNSTVIGYPTITPTIPNTLGLTLIVWSNTSAHSINSPYTEQFERNNTASPSLAGSTCTPANSGSITGALVTSAGQVKYHLALRPAVGL